MDFKVSCPSPWKCTALFDPTAGEFLGFETSESYISLSFAILSVASCFAAAAVSSN